MRNPEFSQSAAAVSVSMETEVAALFCDSQNKEVNTTTAWCQWAYFFLKSFLFSMEGVDVYNMWCMVHLLFLILLTQTLIPCLHLLCLFPVLLSAMVPSRRSARKASTKAKAHKSMSECSPLPPLQAGDRYSPPPPTQPWQLALRWVYASAFMLSRIDLHVFLSQKHESEEELDDEESSYSEARWVRIAVVESPLVLIYLQEK